jgi:hypothetical protein
LTVRWGFKDEIKMNLGKIGYYGVEWSGVEWTVQSRK